MAEESTRVLVVDDERFIREAICDALREASIDAITADREQEAFDLAMRPEIGAAIVDISSPGIGGLDLLRRLGAERPGLRVIVLSTEVDHDRVLEALRLGACDYLAKPLHNEELVLAVRRALLASGMQMSWESLCARLGALEAQLAELETEAGADESGSTLADRLALAVADVLGVSRASLMLLEGDSGLLRVAGANGSGKTSLLRMACGLLEPTAGTVRLDGEDVRRLQEEFWRQLVYVGHANAVKDDLTASENLRIACTLAGVRVRPEQVGEALVEGGLAAR